MGVSVRIITNFNRLLEIENDYNHQLRSSAKNPFLFSRLLSEFMRMWEKIGWTPIVFTFWLDQKLIGVIPLVLQKRLIAHHTSTLKEVLYSDIFLCDEFREICLNLLIDYLFEKLKCRSASLILQTDSANIEILKSVCRNKRLHLGITRFMGRAQIPSHGDWNVYSNSLTRNVRKKSRNTRNKLSKLGRWNIFSCAVTANSIERVLSIERNSWKVTWRAERNEDQDLGLLAYLNAFQQTVNVDYYDSEVWFLEVNGQAIAYCLNLIYDGISFFIKTSYDEHFRKLSPGKFLINAAIREMFRRKTVKMIDAIADPPHMRIWRPIVCQRKRVYIERGNVEFKVKRFVYRYPRIRKLFRSVFDRVNLGVRI